MKRTSFWKTTLVVLGGFGAVLPQDLVRAAEVPVAAKSQQATQAIVDVSLNRDGGLTGYVVDAQGKPQANEAVVLSQGNKLVAKTTTDSKGRFEVKELRGGMYRVSSAKGISNYRVWSNDTAPKSSKQYAMVVAGKQIVRAQDGTLGLGDAGTLAAAGLGIAGLTVGVVAINEANDANDKIDNLPSSP